MRPRLALARSLVRAGELLRSLPVVVLHPSDMVEWSRQTYDRGAAAWAATNDVDEGLCEDELALWARVPVAGGRMLILGGGGGREAVWFARQGWRVSAVDVSPRMLALTRARMAERGLPFDGRVGDLACVDVPPASFDVVWTSMFLYSTVLNRTRRVAMLRRLGDALAPGGVLVVSFFWQPEARSTRKAVLVRKLVAWLTLGNVGYENGDMLFGALEFRHAFGDERELRAELAAGGLELVGGAPLVFEELGRGGAVLQKRAAASAI